MAPAARGKGAAPSPSRAWVRDAAVGEPAHAPGGVRLPPSGRCFPPRLRDVHEEIPLWVRSTRYAVAGLPGLWERPTVAIVGARGASAAGRELAREMAWGLARQGVCIVSGLALGIDAAAHEGALLAGGLTVAVLAGGLDRIYPPENVPLAAEVMAHGALLSEWPAGTTAQGWRFPRRNRLISGLADAVVLVEGSARSGALHTVRYALDQGREVFAVPRDPLIPGSVAPNRLLRDGAVPATCAGDILDQLAPASRGGAGTLSGGAAPPASASVRPAPAPPAAAIPVNGHPEAGPDQDGPGQDRPGQDGPGQDRPGQDRPCQDGPSEGGLCQGGLSEDGACAARIRHYLRRHGTGSVEALLVAHPDLPAAGMLSALMQMEIEGEVRQDGRGGWRRCAS